MERVRLLQIEDDENDAELVRLELEKSSLELDWARVDNESDLRRCLAQGHWDIAISDFAMPGFDGLSAFRILQEVRPETPFIFVSGVLGEERAVEAMRAGARDYILKENLVRLGVAVRRELSSSRTRRSERSLEVQAREEARRLAMAVGVSGAGIFEFLPEQHELLYVNNRLLEILGIELAEAYAAVGSGKFVPGLIHPDDLTRLGEVYERFLSGEDVRLTADVRVRHKGGHWVDIAIFSKAVSRGADGRALHVIGVVMDITERRGLEVQLRQAQKMEAVGRLAGGVAHDFNNLLTAIFSFAEFAQRSVAPNSTPYKDIEEVLKAAERAKELTSQLLTFSRRKPSVPRVVDVNEVLRDIKRMLSRLVGEDVRVETILEEGVGNVRIDPGSFEQVIVNLAVNARDAMPEGGRLTIATEKAETAVSVREGTKAANEEYIRIRVSDEGVGMDEDTVAQIFEPFFTTKGVGIGTGLGLSTCYGIVKQAGGSVFVESSPGAGTTFLIALPVTRELPRDGRETKVLGPLGGTETVLVVEDEEQLRRLVVRTLSSLGYRVLAAANGVAAIQQAGELVNQIDLLLTDVVMPEMGGNVLAEKLREQNPQLKVLYMSGYNPGQMTAPGGLGVEAPLLEKPFSPQGVAQAVRRTLDSGPASAWK